MKEYNKQFNLVTNAARYNDLRSLILFTFAEMSNLLKSQIHDVLSGKSKVRYGETIQTIAHYLRESQKASPIIKGTKQFKEQEKQKLEKYIFENVLWLFDIDLSLYVSEGAEQKVYLKNSSTVIKLNDAIYYLSWIDYLNNLLLHNYFFQDTAYDLVGFTKINQQLFAVVE